jgi:multicomponent Na+:H+ antiporter subunit F
MIAQDLFLPVALMLVIYIVGCAVRMFLGPTTPDRAVALDTINTLVVAAMIALGVAYREVLFIDIAIVYALLSFITTLYIARYMENKAMEEGEAQ